MDVYCVFGVVGCIKLWIVVVKLYLVVFLMIVLVFCMIDIGKFVRVMMIWLVYNILICVDFLVVSN